MLTVEIEGNINEMLGGTFYEVYERTSKAKKTTRDCTYRVRRIRNES